MRKLIALLILCTAADLAGAPLMFRGNPAHTAVYPATSGRNLVGMQWRFPTGGEVSSSPIVADDTVYVGSGDGKLYAIDLWTGAEKWSYDAGSAISSSPALADNTLYFATRNGALLALGVNDRRIRWKKQTGADQPFPWGHESGDFYISSPVIDGDTVIFGAGDGNVYALNAANGSTRWTAATGERIRATPAVADGGVFVGTAGGKLYRFDRATGKREWSYATAGASLASGDFGYDRRTLQSSPAIANGIAYVGARDGQLYAVDANTGTLRWKSDYGLPWVITSPALEDGRVYIGSSDGHFVQCLNGSDGKELWKTDVGTLVWSSPALSGDLVFAGDGDGRLHAFDRENGTRLWSFMTGGMVMSSPVVAYDLVVFGSSDRAVYALRTGSTPVQRVVYAHMAKPEDDATKLVKMLNERGYTTPATATDVAKFLADRADDRAPSVIVFTNSRLPDEVKPVLRRYLDSGGKVVWTAAPVGLVPNDPEALKTLGPKALDFDAAYRLLGVNHATVAFDERGTRATAAGRRWGLEGWWRATWGVPVDQVTEALSLDEWGSTTEWVKTYGGPPGTGFVRARRSDNNTLYWMSEYRPSAKPVENRTP